MIRRTARAVSTPDFYVEDDSIFFGSDQEVPSPIPVFDPSYASVPATLKAEKRWLAFQLTWNAETGKFEKKPFNPSTGKVTNDHEQSTSFADALAFISSQNNFVLGFYVEKPYVGIDLDGCRDKENGLIADWAFAIIKELDSYAEVSPSGTGVRIIVEGEKPGEYCRRGSVEIYSKVRGVTITGLQIAETPNTVNRRDISQLYERMTAGDYVFTSSEAKTKTESTPKQPGPPAQIQSDASLIITNKLTLLTMGSFTENAKPFIVSDGHNSLEYDSQSEAIAALLSCLAFKHDGDANKIEEDYYESNLSEISKWKGDKWERLGKTEIAKAIEFYQKFKAKSDSTIPVEDYSATVAAPTSAERIVDTGDEDAIPPFDPSVINGIYADFVELVTRGTTLAPQFAYVIAKTIVGLRMAGKVTFETLDAEPRYYTALIGETGSGKGEAWRRTQQILQPEGALVTCKIKLINSFDSGAGIKDLFFEPPEDEPVLCYVDEIVSLGNKAHESRNPAILDTMIELADSTSISRVLAKSKGGGAKTKRGARLAMVMCGQDGMTYAKSCAGRTNMGFWDRLYPEFGVPVETGNLPPVPVRDAVMLLSKLNSLDYSGTVRMSPSAADRLNEFWEGQPPSVKRKARFKKNLILDAYMSAFGRWSRTVETTDMGDAIRIFARQLVIRRVCFTTEVPDRVGHYLAIIQKLTERMSKQLAKGAAPESVALSRRDYEKQTNAHRDNESHIFAKAFDVHAKVWLQPVTVKKSNGQTYTKYLPDTDD